MIARTESGEEPRSPFFEDTLPPPPPPPSPKPSESGIHSLDGEMSVTIEIEVYEVETTQRPIHPSNSLDARYMAMTFRYVLDIAPSFVTDGRKAEAELVRNVYQLVHGAQRASVRRLSSGVSQP